MVLLPGAHGSVHAGELVDMNRRSFIGTLFAGLLVSRLKARPTKQLPKWRCTSCGYEFYCEVPAYRDGPRVYCAKCASFGYTEEEQHRAFRDHIYPLQCLELDDASVFECIRAVNASGVPEKYRFELMQMFASRIGRRHSWQSRLSPMEAVKMMRGTR